MVLGIDTASVAGNKTVDWAKAKANGIAFAIIRGAYGTAKDKNFDRDWPAMKQAGVVRGAYLFLRFPYEGRPAPTPKAQAEAICKFVGKLDSCDLPISLDIEFPGDGRKSTWLDPATKKPMSAKQLLDGAHEAWDVLYTNYGVAPLTYSSARVWLDDLLNLPAPWATESLLWLAKYNFSAGPAVLNPGNVTNPPVPPPWAGSDPTPIKYRNTPYSNDNFAFHQFQGNATGCPGFPSGNVDMNRFRPIQKGANGEKVKWVQRRLGFTGKDVDGKFGPMTDRAVRNLQAGENDVVADGIIGPRTLAYLCWMNP